jgi:PAS domain S-box-containing protein
MSIGNLSGPQEVGAGAPKRGAMTFSLLRLPTTNDLRASYASIVAIVESRLRRSAAPRVPWLVQIMVVVGCVGASLVVRGTAGLFAPGLISYSTFLPAIAIAALFAGRWAGLVTLVLSLLLNLSLTAPAAAMVSTRTQVVAAALFVLAGVVQLFLAVLLRETIWQGRRSEQRHRALLQSLTEIVWESDASGAGLDRQPAWEALTGMKWPDYRGLGWLNAVHPDDRAAIIPRAPFAGQAVFVSDARIRDQQSNDWRWFRVRALPLQDDDGKIERWIGSLDDIHEERMAGERRELQMAELRHRLKNLIAVIQALATYSQPKDEPKVEEFAKKFMARLHALASSGDLVIASNLQDVDLSEAIQAALKPFIADTKKPQLKIDGPPIRLREPTAAGIALAIHELATNALKYGALSVPNGSADISWKLILRDDGEQFQLEWRERDGPPAHKPNREGFGTRLIRMAVAREKDPSVTIDFTPAGVVCVMTFTRAAAAKT